MLRDPEEEQPSASVLGKEVLLSPEQELPRGVKGGEDQQQILRWKEHKGAFSVEHLWRVAECVCGGGGRKARGW